ncbi:lipoic acid synthetase [Natronincola peptidivorans]|uniref:Lipoyl synthase n=1 Tax=Natronincola peptidivorans TaxID=426128 RepID=A0A1I0BN58_9FIRM|nr:lipoyl synthase [Natronincola peptidivorans]SET07730.1 lipoic acid synthetase [Natronincola peptidivorans]
MIKNRPPWLRKKAPNQESLNAMEKMLKSLSLHTVCEGADCPNIGECFENQTATFMILGKTCTRNCRFCAVSKESPEKLDEKEPQNVAIAVEKLGLKHVVITSVTRDDLLDGGAGHFAKTINEIKNLNKGITIEVLIPDFAGNLQALKEIIKAKPEIINHNLETVPSLYQQVRPQADYQRSLSILKAVKDIDGSIVIKTGIMLGLGEKEEEIIRVMEDLIKINCDILTLGQYLQPTKEHIEVVEYIPPEKFDDYKERALNMGFKYVASGPFVRSSYNAVEALNVMK